MAPIEGILGIEIVDLPTDGLARCSGPMGQLGAAVIIALATAAVLGLIAHYAVFRPLRYAPVLAKVVASVGIMLFLQAAVVLRFGSRAKSADPIFPNEPIDFLGVRVGQDRLWLLATVALATAALWARVQATPGSGSPPEPRPRTSGSPPCWGSTPTSRPASAGWWPRVLAGLVGILVAPITGVTPNFFTVLLISSLGAALLGRMSSFVVAALAGLACSACSTRSCSGSSWSSAGSPTSGSGGPCPSSSSPWPW